MRKKLKVKKAFVGTLIRKMLGDKTIDQCFLRDVIYPIAKENLFLHDEFFNYERIGTHIKRNRNLDDFAFIGESVDENDIPRGDQRTSIRLKYNLI